MSSVAQERGDLVSVVLRLAVILGMGLASLWVLSPFLGALIWAAMIVIATWPVLLGIQRVLWGKRSLAVLVMVLGLLLTLILPLGIGLGALLGQAGHIEEWGRALAANGLPPVPAWIAGLPFVGDRLAHAWGDLAAGGSEGLIAKLGPHVGEIGTWLAARAGGLGGLMVQFLLTVLISAILFTNGESAAHGVILFFRRLGGDQAEGAVRLAGRAIRSVAMGIVVTAVAQTLLAGLGLLVAGVPFVPVLAAVVMVCCVVQVGVFPVLAPCVIWLYSTGHPVAGTFLLVWTVGVGAMDNVLRPILIRRGADLPLLLVFAGVLGGLLSLGLIGLFVGPIILAVTFTLLQAWVKAGSESATDGAAALDKASAMRRPNPPR